jgi:hypothetical protein
VSGRSSKDAGKRWHLSTPAIAGLLAIVSGVVTLFFTFSPSSLPDPGENINATMKVLAVEPHVTYGQLLDQTGQTTKDPAERTYKGSIIYLSIEVKGRKRKRVTLEKTIHRAPNGSRIDEPDAVLGFTSETPSDRWVAPVFEVDPLLGQRFFVRYELFDRDTILAIAETPSIASGE